MVRKLRLRLDGKRSKQLLTPFHWQAQLAKTQSAKNHKVFIRICYLLFFICYLPYRIKVVNDIVFCKAQVAGNIGQAIAVSLAGQFAAYQCQCEGFWC